MIVDTHCHFDMMENPERYIQEQERIGNIVIGMTNLPSHFNIGIKHIKRYRQIRLALGFHPQLAAINQDELSLFSKYVEQTSYIGEIGLDFSKDFLKDKDIQIESLKHILSILKGRNKIVSVHSRKAEKQLLELLKEYEIKNVIFHWYSGPLSLVDNIIAQGYYFSINEAMTISANGQNIINYIPKDRILTETDAPFNQKTSIVNTIHYLGLTEIDIKRNFNKLIEKIR